ncbi:MAG: HYR domain-containing protein [Vicingaceae bacterium]|nr:MAG: HYR domain-containing protein [Vicingaceae bacterium]WKZ75788.1 MAG: HYR domain-containing protein [Vicingaceae bacterium]
MKKLLSITAGVLSAFTVSAQCPQITCPSNITVNNAPGTCAAVVNYVTPVGTNPCGSGSQTFNYTGSTQTFTVPVGITSITIETRGAQGAQGNGGAGGFGARMIGDFTVTPGQILTVVVGGMGTTSQNAGGGGGGSGVINGNTPLCIAGGGGGGAINEIGQPGLTTTSGGNSSGLGGTAGNGGQKGYQSGDCGWAGGGGGFTGDGYGGDGSWDGGSLPGTLSGPASGKSHANGGAGGIGGGCQFSNTGAGGYGCGGGGRGEYGGGGGGGYSGGGGGQYVSGTNQKGGGGGGSFNSGTNQSNTAGYQSGNGQVIISWTGGPATTTQTAGLPDGATFPVGVTTNWYKVEDGLGNADSCSFTVTVVDNEAPSITCPGDTTICWGVYNANITSSDNCPGATVTQTNGPTLGSSFDVGTYNLVFVVTDASGNKDTCDYNVTVEVCGGVNENNQKYGISVYPNPMREYVIIENKHIEGKYTIEITNTLGGIVKTINTTEKRVEIQKGDMSKGMYYYSIKQNNQTLGSGKLAVE